LFYLCVNCTKSFLYYWEFISVLNVLEHIINDVSFNDLDCFNCITLIISYLSNNVLNYTITCENVSESLLFKCKNCYVKSFCLIFYSFKLLFSLNVILFVAYHNEFSDACCINFSSLILYNLILWISCLIQWILLIKLHLLNSYSDK